MKKIIMACIILGVMTIAANGFAKEYRVQCDMLFLNEQDAVDLINVLETYKSKAYQPTGEEGIHIPTHIRLIDSWDTHTPPLQGNTRYYSDFDEPAQTLSPAGKNKKDLQIIVDELEQEISQKENKVNAKKQALQQYKDELNALSTTE